MVGWLWFDSMKLQDLTRQQDEQLADSLKKAASLSTQLKANQRTLDRERSYNERVTKEHEHQIDLFEDEMTELHDENHRLTLKLEDVQVPPLATALFTLSAATGITGPSCFLHTCLHARRTALVPLTSLPGCRPQPGVPEWHSARLCTLLIDCTTLELFSASPLVLVYVKLDLNKASERFKYAQVALDEALHHEGAAGDAADATLQELRGCQAELSNARGLHSAAETKAGQWKALYDEEVLSHSGTVQRLEALQVAAAAEVVVDPVPPAPRRAAPVPPAPVPPAPAKRTPPPGSRAQTAAKRAAQEEDPQLIPPVPEIQVEQASADERAQAATAARARRRPAVPAPTKKEYVVEESF